MKKFLNRQKEWKSTVPSGEIEKERIELLLNLYMDGEASKEQQVQAELLLQTDKYWVNEFSAMQKLSRSTAKVADIMPPLILVSAVLSIWA